MNKEIKEILDKLNNGKWEKDTEEIAYKILFSNEVYQLLDYITNLQEENDKLNEVIETLKETNHLLINQKYKLEYELDLLDSKRDKAIEYIKKNILISFDKVGFKTNKVAGIVVDELLNLLQGEDE